MFHKYCLYVIHYFLVKRQLKIYNTFINLEMIHVYASILQHIRIYNIIQIWFCSNLLTLLYKHILEGYIWRVWWGYLLLMNTYKPWKSFEVFTSMHLVVISVTPYIIDDAPRVAMVTQQEYLSFKEDNWLSVVENWWPQFTYTYDEHYIRRFVIFMCIRNIFKQLHIAHRAISKPQRQNDSVLVWFSVRKLHQ